MIMIACEKCSKMLPVDMSGLVRCGCGHRFVCKAPMNLCIYRNSRIGIADCDCKTKPAVYQCDLLATPCMENKPVEGAMSMIANDGNRKTVDPANCSKCEKALRVRRTNLPNNSQSVAIITTHYNPAGFTRLRETWREWQPTIGDVVTMELVIGGEPEIDGSVAIRGTANNLLWQKERLINLAITRLPPEVRTVAWVDHDIVFEDPQWLVESQRMIDGGLDCVQPFATIKYQDRSGRVERSAKSAAAVALAGGNPGTAPGAAWVASRAWLESIGGLYDRSIVGGGDAVFFEAVSGKRTKYRERQSEPAQLYLSQWIDSVGAVKYGHLPGSVRHIWHGDFRNRQYTSRDAILCQFGYDPELHTKFDVSGLLSWTDAASPEFRRAVADYFSARREDG